MTLLRVFTGVVTVLTISACTPGTSEVGPSAAPTTFQGASPSAAALKYRYAALDLCSATDLAPLAELKLTLVKKRRDVPPGRKGEGEVCLYEMKTPGGHIARLTVEAITAKSLDEAKSIYQGNSRNMNPAGEITGLGDQAEARTLDTETGYKHTEYLIHLRSENLHISVWLAVGGTSFTPKETLAPRTRPIADATLATVSRAWG